jgi:hypothetical protein
LKDYFAKYTRTYKNHKNTCVESVIVNCQFQLFLDNMVLANQNAKLTGPDQGFLVSPPRPHTKALGTRLRRWHKALDETQRVIRILFLDFRKAFDLIDHNKLLENMCNIGVRPALVEWFLPRF